MYKYISTRNANLKLPARQAILTGVSTDGGLFVLPNLDDQPFPLDYLMEQSYFDIAFQVLKRLLPDFSDIELATSIHQAYDHKFDNPQIAPVKKVDDFHVLELFHGPTHAFKDFGLQLLPQLMQMSLDRQHRVIILAATSGDTGSAALAGFKGQPQMNITVFYPEHGVSSVQKQQMLTIYGPNTHAIAIRGNFDDAQHEVKQILNNQQSANTSYTLSSANSINIGRLAPQVVYYFAAYQQLVANGTIQMNDSVIFTVPTGNFGDVLAGYYAKKLGLPIQKLVVACNANHVLADFFNTGIYDRNRPFFKTVAPSMDIQIASNLERLLYYISDGDTAMVKDLMDQLATTGRYQINTDLLSKLQTEFTCGFSDDTQIKSAIKEVYEKYNYLMDPHTASGYRMVRQVQKENPDIPVVLLSTASPYKFGATVTDALIGEHRDNAQSTNNLLQSLTNIKMPQNLMTLWDQPIQPMHPIDKDAMSAVVQKIMQEDIAHD